MKKILVISAAMLLFACSGSGGKPENPKRIFELKGKLTNSTGNRFTWRN